MKKGKMTGKLLFIPDFKGKTIQIHLYSYTKWIVTSVLLILISFFSFSVYRYVFYQKKLFSLMNEQRITSNSINEISMDGIQTKRELMRLKYEIDSMDKFISAANLFDKDAIAKLSVPFSSTTFADYFKTNTNKYDSAHPASSMAKTIETQADKDRNLKYSQERQASLSALMDITPSGYPLIGKVTLASKYNLKRKGPALALESPVGTPIYATATGKILSFENITKDCYIIEIEHNAEKNKKVKTYYYFCYKPVIKIGQKVKKGQLIAFSGIHPGSGDNVTCYQVFINNFFIQPNFYTTKINS